MRIILAVISFFVCVLIVTPLDVWFDFGSSSVNIALPISIAIGLLAGWRGLEIVCLFRKLGDRLIGLIKSDKRASKLAYGTLLALGMCSLLAFGLASLPSGKESNIQENPYTAFPDELMTPELDHALGYFKTPFEETGLSVEDGEGTLNENFTVGEVVFLGEKCELTVEYFAPEEGAYPLRFHMEPSSGGFDIDRLEDLESKLESVLGELASDKNCRGYGSSMFPIPDTGLALYVHGFGFTIENQEHPRVIRSAWEAAAISNDLDLAGTGLTRELTETYDVDGLKLERKYRKYSYYDENGDLVGVKTIWGDGRESDTIFSDHEDEYNELP